MGKKSGPLAFLNKKGWHPGNQRNQEKVWKKEQEALAEKKQVEELRKQYDEARQKEEVEAMAVAAGVKKKQERLDWMYQGGMVAKAEAEKRADAQLLGEKEVDLPAAEAASKAEEVAQLPSFYTQDTPASANEMWQKLHGDPMFAIKQQELMARKNIVANPVQMDAIKRQLKAKTEAKALRKAAKAEAKAAKKAAKRAKKDKKRKRAQKSSSSDSESDASEENRSPKRSRATNGQGEQRVEPVVAGGRSRHRSRDSNDVEGSAAVRRDSDYRGRYNGDSDYRGRYNGDSHGSRDYHESNGREQREHRAGHSREGNGHSREGRHPDESRRHRDAQSSRREERGRDRDFHRRGEGHEGRGPGPSGREEVAPANKKSEVKVYRDGASTQGRDLSFGLNAATNATEIDRDAKKRETEKRLEEARLQREAEEKEKAGQRYKRKEHRTGQLSEEEKARRLAEMSGNADAHEDARWARLQAARKRDDTEAEQELLALRQKAAASAQPGTHHQDTAQFLRQATKQAFSGEHASLADRVGRRKYTNDRSRDEAQGAFQRS